MSGTIFLPATIGELCAALTERARGGAAAIENIPIIAGGTDVVVQAKSRAFKLSGWIDISGVEELRRIEFTEDALRVGACATMTSIAQNTYVLRHARALAQAAAFLGSRQVRNRATLGGNLANASPAADTVPALSALGASAAITDSDGNSRLIPVRELAKEIRGGLLKGGRYISSVEIALTKTGKKVSAFVKLGAREKVAISKLNLAFCADVEGGVWKNPRLAMGAVGLDAAPLEAAASILDGASLSDLPTLSETLADCLSAEVERLIAGRASMPYKREAIRGLAFDLLQSAKEGSI